MCVSVNFINFTINLIVVPLFTPNSPPLVTPSKKPEIVIFVGYPASGKTTFANKWFMNDGYAHVNQVTQLTLNFFPYPIYDSM